MSSSRMISMQDAEGHAVGTNNHFSGMVREDREWKPFPFEFQPLPGTAVIRVRFLVTFPGSADAWIDDVVLEMIE